jgi:1-deoxy-D-xylulose-5-phosphate synthase
VFADEVDVLDSIDGPADLKGLDAGQLEVLAGQIRRFIVDSVSLTGGHLGSNLGVVELTLAIHRVFESPRDVILWDTGHQAYVHKIVTGRREAFAGLRQAGGLSGYPCRAESPHDWVENSHASTILSYAHGLVTAFGLRGEVGRSVVAVLGDGSLTGGMAYEALNNLGHGGGRVVVVLNDNGRSYSPTVGRLAGESDALKSFFGALGVRYLGPVDGHDITRLESVLVEAAAHDAPVVVHALTRKGLGYGPAEDDDEKCLHDTSMFDPATGPPRWVPAGYTQSFADAVVAAGERDGRIVAVTAAMAGPTGLRPFQDRFPARFLDVGIAEQHAVTSAAGLALGGLRPVVAIYSTFLTRAIDQVNLDVGLHRLPVVFCVDRAGITGDDGPSHHGVLDMALLSKVPGMTVLAPSSAQELEVMLTHALGAEGPVAIRYPKGPARQVDAAHVGSGLSARLVQRGADVCVLAVGPLVEAAEGAAELLAHQGLDATVWDARAVKPLDGAMLADATAHPLVVTVEDGVVEGGFGGAVAQVLAGRHVWVATLGVPLQYIPHGNRARILAELGLDAAGIAATVVAALGARQPTVDPHAASPTGREAGAGGRFHRIDVESSLPLALHPLSEEIERRCYDRARPLLIDHFGSEALAERYIGQRMPLWACACYPHMAADRCHVLPTMMIPGSIIDDSFSRPEVMRSVDHAARLRDRFCDVLDAMGEPGFPAGRMLYDALALVTAQMSASQAGRYVASLRQVVESRVLEAAARATGTVLDFESYMALRRTDLFGYWATIQAEYAIDVDMATLLSADPRLAEARDLAIEHMVFVNDLFSFPKEYDADEVMNSIWVFLRRGGLELGEAVEKLRELIVETEESFLAVRDEILGGTGPDSDVARYLLELGHLISGNLHYHRCTTRYGGDDVVRGQATSANL